jgi:hypothetical protein
MSDLIETLDLWSELDPSRHLDEVGPAEGVTEKKYAAIQPEAHGTSRPHDTTKAGP